MTGVFAGALAVQMLTAMVLITTSAAKFKRMDEFAGILRQYALLRSGAVVLAAWLIALAELTLGVALLIPDLRYTAVALSIALFAVFALAVAVNLLRGRTDIRCGCSLTPGAGDQLRWWMVIRNLLLCVALLGSLVVVPTSVAPMEAIAVAGASASLAAIYHALPELLYRQPRRAAVR